MSASFLSIGSVILKYLNSHSIPSNHSSQAFPVAHGSSGAIKGNDRKFLVSVITRTVGGAVSPSAISLVVNMVCGIRVFTRPWVR